MAVSPLFIGSDMNLSVTGTVDASDGTTYLNSGTWLWVLKDSAGTTVSSGSLSYVAASNGNYLGVIASSVTSGLTEGAIYTITLTFSQGNYDDVRKANVTAGYRGEV